SPFPGNEAHIGRIYDAFQDLPQSQREEVERDLRTVDELACESGIKTLIEEGHWQGIDLSRELDALEGLHSKAMWAFLRRSCVFDVAPLFTAADGMNSRHWVRTKDLPAKEPDTSDRALQGLQEALSAYYRREQGRGHNCTVEHYTRRNRSHYF